MSGRWSELDMRRWLFSPSTPLQQGMGSPPQSPMTDRGTS